MQMQCQCGRYCHALLMVKIWIPGKDDAVDELVCPDCAREYAEMKSSNPFDEIATGAANPDLTDLDLDDMIAALDEEEAKQNGK